MLDTAVLNALPDAVYVLDPESSRIVACNQAAWADLGLTRDAVLNHSVLSLQKDVQGLPQWTEIAAVIRAHDPYTFIGRHRHADGSEVPVEVRTSVLWHQGREYFLSVARNISHRVAHDEEIAGRPPEVWLALHDTADGVWDWSIPDGHVYFSPGLKQMLGYGPQEMPPVVETWKNNIHPADAPFVLHNINEHLAGRRSRYQAEYRLRNRNGHYLWVQDRGKICQRDAEGNPSRIIGMVHDITDLKSQTMEWQHHAQTDALTGLYNRRRGEELAERKLEQCRRDQRPCCVCLIDIDHFKPINDQHGHLVGDQVLKGIAEELARHKQPSDVLFRWGGEEFLLLLPNHSSQQARQHAEQIREALAKRHWPDPMQQTQITASFGLACYPKHSDALSPLIAQADRALYAAKHAGRNCVMLAEDDQR